MLKPSTLPITKRYVENVLSAMMRRCEAAKNAGGIRHLDVVQDKLDMTGYHYDPYTQWWIPDGVELLPL